MKNNYPKVSIITVNFNGKKYLERLFGSIFRLNYPKDKFEAIFIDNASTDNSVEFTGKNYPGVRIIKNNINNYCKAVNLGIGASKSEYLALVNNDVRLDKNWLIELIKAIAEDKRIAAVGSKILDMSGKIQNAAHYELPNFYWGERGAGRESQSYDAVEEAPSLCAAAVLYRKDALYDAGLFDEDFIIYGEDVEMSLRLRQKGWKLIFVPSSIAYHQFHGTATEELARYYIERNRLLFLAKHYPHKLSSSLIGNGYFTVQRSLGSYGKIYSVYPEIITKLIKTHPLDIASQVISELFGEIKKIVNHENDLLIKKFNEMADDQREKVEEAMRLNTQITQFKDELDNISNQLRQRMDEVLLKEGLLSQRDRELACLKDELDNISNQLRQRMDEALLKEGLLSEREKDLACLRDELGNISNQLRQRMDEVLLRDAEISRLTGELNGIYNSEGFRFILRPLWTAILNAREYLRAAKRKLSGSIWLAVTIMLTPLFLLLYLSFLLEYLGWFILGPLMKRTAAKRRVNPSGENKISLVMPNYNGIDCLKECLPSVFSVEEFANGKNEVLVVDDGSTDGSADFIKNNFPQVRLIENERNRGFGFSCNRGISCAENEVIVLINNDIILSRDFLNPLISHLQQEDVFAATPKLYAWDRKTFNWGMHMGRFEEGYVRLWNEAETGNADKISQAAPTFFAIGGAMAFRKSDFLWLGGFDGIYRPNCWEDIDISYQAWKRGLKVLYEPKSLIYHKARATLTYERPKEIKNELLFTWKNITDPGILKKHLSLLPFHLCHNRMNFLKGFLWALRYLPPALLHRFLNRRYIRAQDKGIFDRCMLYYRNFIRRGFRQPREGEKNKVLLITPFMPYPLRSGGKVRIHTLARLLKDKFDISLLTLIDRKEELNCIPELQKVFKEVYAVFPKTEVKSRLYPARYKYAHSHILIDKLNEIQKRQPLDLIQIESNELLYLANHIKHIPIIYTEHDSSALFFKGSYYHRKEGTLVSNLFDYLKRVRLHCSLYKKLDRVILLSRQDKQVLKAFFPKTNFSLIPTGVDLGHFSFLPAGRPKAKRLVYVGHYPHYPNEDAVTYFTEKIFPRLLKKMPELEFLIVGSSPTEKIKELSRRPKIRLISDVEDVSLYLRESAIFVNPIRISAGIKGKVLEAMATGIPVVSTAVGASGIDALGQKEILIADTPAAFARAVLRLFKDAALYSKIASAAREMVEEKYNWQKISHSLIRAYEQAMELEPASPEQKEEVSFDKLISLSNRIVEEAVEKCRFRSGYRQGPEELHLELTYRCDSNCVMCDLWDYRARVPGEEKELTLDEIRNFVGQSEHLKKIKTVVLSGGEPFLRKDLAEICAYFTQRLPGVSLGILTNGINTGAIINSTKEIVKKCRPRNIWIGSSLDGIGEAHDRIRAKKGAFSSLEKTIQACKKEGVNITLTFTLTTANFDQLIPARNFAASYGVEFYVQFVVPKEVREKAVFNFTPAQLARIEGDLYRMMREEAGDKDYRQLLEALRGDSYQGLVAKLYYLSNLVRYQQQPKRYFKRCVAGSKFAMFSPFGDLYFCPGLKNGSIGNIRKEKFDTLWASKKAESVREFINQGLCHCWLVCVVFPAIDEARSAAGGAGEEGGLEIPLKEQESTLPLGADGHLPEENSSLNEQEYQAGKLALESTPRGIGIGAHWSCDAGCIFCLGGYPRLFDLRTYSQFFEKRLFQALPRADFINLCGFGELLLMPHCQEFLSYINHSLPFSNKILTTNGTALSESINRRLTEGKYSLQISLHASKKELHRMLTRIDSFERIVAQIQQLLSIRKGRQSPSVNLIFVVNSLNIENLPEFIEFAAGLGVDSVLVNYMTIYSPAHLKLSCFFKQEIARRMFSMAKEKAARYGLALSLPPQFGGNGSVYQRCSDPWKYLYVETEGSILPCCYAGAHIGYLYRDKFEEIWNGEFYKNLRKSLSEGKAEGWCKYCYKNNPANVNDIRSHVSFRPDLQSRILKGISLK